MSNSLKHRALAAALLLFAPAHCLATTFISFDARTLAMGGVGVATGRPANAALFNPSLLAQTHTEHLDGTFAHLYLGARLIDRDDFLSRVDQFQDNYSEDKLDALLLSARAAFQDGQLDAHQLRTLASEGEGLVSAIEGLSNRPIRAAAAAGFSVGHTADGWGAGLFVRHYAILGGQFELADIDLLRMQQLVAITRASADVIEFGERSQALIAAIDYQRIETLIRQSIQDGRLNSELLSYQDIPGVAELINAFEATEPSLQVLLPFIDLDGLTQALRAQNQGVPLEQLGLGDIDLRDYLRYQAPETFESEVLVSGAEIQETALGGAWQLYPDQLTLGVNLKQLDITLIDFSAPVAQIEFEDYQLAKNQTNYIRPNLDIGMEWVLNDRWNLGAVVRNVVPFTLTSRLGTKRTFRPIARAGLGYRGDHFNVGIDVDLTTNEPLGFDPKKQYIGVGVEYYLWQQTAVRAGYRINRYDHSQLPSLGLGIGFDQGHLDFAVARSERFDEYGVSIQLGMHF
ncbi:conjugal transfer protein TraF [Simiduia aestuariiviva]|uniref:Conjugal transfer protein TraF n=1 Tax=Simiduia aestuariiviva TaxID=1510459 RepID=A0A839UQD4_9GAMM|nr:conjugal transfer protein TraF [Simiduia aestuariiviva]MBB3167575.1 hypothetical protein [Simiduia aestuariiviva]